MEVTLKIKDNVYEEIEEQVEDKILVKRVLVKKNVITNLNIDTNDILLITDHINSKGNIKKNYCRIHLKEVGQILVNHSRQYVSNLKQHKFNAIGFKQKH